MRTAAELLEKAETFEALAARAKDDLLRATYLDCGLPLASLGGGLDGLRPLHAEAEGSRSGTSISSFMRA